MKKLCDTNLNHNEQTQFNHHLDQNLGLFVGHLSLSHSLVSIHI